MVIGLGVELGLRWCMKYSETAVTNQWDGAGAEWWLFGISALNAAVWGGAACGPGAGRLSARRPATDCSG